LASGFYSPGTTLGLGISAIVLFCLLFITMRARKR
jgi:hypothetical protein